MNRFTISICCTFALFLFSCTGHQNQGPPPSVAKQKAEYDVLAKQMVQSVAYIGEPLKDMTDEQMASVAALLVMTRTVTQAEGIETIAGSGIAEAFWTEVSKIYPPGKGPKPRTCNLAGGGCFDADIAYLSCLVSRVDKTTEKECWPESAAANACHMKQFEELRECIKRDIPGRQWPDQPFPWSVRTGPE